MKRASAVMMFCVGALLVVGCSSKKAQPVAAMPVPVQQVLVCSEVREPVEKYDATRQKQNDAPVTYRSKICTDGTIFAVQELSSPNDVLIIRKTAQ
ncbi:MAG TPA: hypothetical protein VLH56_05370 [Dissulfurispiraceae bacterium]|nr:hypothetical protein [Dissulfurispiraceae bacterium]